MSDGRRQEHTYTEKWSVEVNGVSHGPVTTLQIIEGLLNAQYKVTQRVSRDQVNWKSICNDPFFEDAIRDLLHNTAAETVKVGAATDELGANSTPSTGDERSGFYNLTDLKKGISEQLEHAQRLTEMAANANGLRKLLVDIPTHRKVVKTIEYGKTETLHETDQDEIVIIDKSRNKSAWWKNKQFLNMARNLAILGAIYLGFNTVMERKRVKESQIAEQMKRDALQAKALGDYDKAVLLFQGMPASANLDAATLLEMADANLRVQNLSESLQLCQRALKVASTDKDKARAHALMGAIAARSNNLDQAVTEYKLSVATTDVFSSLHNLGIVYLNKKDPKSAEPLFLKALQLQSADKGPTVLALFDSVAGMEASAQSERWDRLEKLLSQVASDSPQYGEAALVAKIRIASAKGESAVKNALIEQFLDLDPKSVPQIKPVADLDYSYATWNHVYTWCWSVYDKENSNALVHAFAGACMDRVWGAKQALPHLEFAYKALPENKYVRGNLAYLLLELGRMEEAQNILRERSGYDTKDGLTNLSYVSLMDICNRQKGVDCPSKTNSDLLQLVGVNLSSGKQFSVSTKVEKVGAPGNSSPSGSQSRLQTQLPKKIIREPSSSASKK